MYHITKQNPHEYDIELYSHGHLSLIHVSADHVRMDQTVTFDICLDYPKHD